jgi:hypothetical protein
MTSGYIQAQINITVNAAENNIPISPYIYGKNNNLSGNPQNPLNEEEWTLLKDAGVRIYRENGGNNCTKYNWKAKLSSHPDWYNNVYSNDWDFAASSLLANTENTQGFFGFQVLGKVASSKDFNFNDWAYNGSQWWTGTTNNWAGGGGPSGPGNPDLYLKNWPADSTVGILDHWFNNLKLDKNRLMYWNMDNEPEIWNYTHDDATGEISAEEFIQRYIKVAKAAREKFPDIKLVGPVSPNEWQWYAWNNNRIKDPKDGKLYVWMEYFIKRIAEEQKASGVKLLDVLDVHFYPGSANEPDLTLQLHRVWFDTTFVYSKANGVKTTSPSGWDDSIKKEYFFHRCNQWLNKYMGTDHMVRMGISEYGQIADSNTDPNIVACWYASHLGTFADKGVELFTPWDWYKGQWEVLHLFSNYFGNISAKSVSDADNIVSAYSSLTQDKDSLIIALVNKDRTGSRSVNIELKNFTANGSSIAGFQLANLSGETFISKNDNALQKKQFAVSDNKMNLTLPALSVTMIQIPSKDRVAAAADNRQEIAYRLYPNPTDKNLIIETDTDDKLTVSVLDIAGKELIDQTEGKSINADVSDLDAGIYFVKIRQGDNSVVEKIIIR